MDFMFFHKEPSVWICLVNKQVVFPVGLHRRNWNHVRSKRNLGQMANCLLAYQSALWSLGCLSKYLLQSPGADMLAPLSSFVPAPYPELLQLMGFPSPAFHSCITWPFNHMLSWFSLLWPSSLLSLPLSLLLFSIPLSSHGLVHSTGHI